eukprot:scaffold127461_cov26-Prasinocladus_malaysianus.AAC.1
MEQHGLRACLERREYPDSTPGAYRQQGRRAFFKLPLASAARDVEGGETVKTGTFNLAFTIHEGRETREVIRRYWVEKDNSPAKE